MDDVVEQYVVGQAERCREMLKESPDNELLQSALDHAERAKECLGKVRSADGEDALKECVRECVKRYSTSVLDQTFKVEQLLVDNNFSSLGTLKDMQSILDSLALSVKVCRLVVAKESGDDSSEPLSLLDKECTECLFWRAGALLYMFCHTKMAAEDGEADPFVRGPETVDPSMIRKLCVAGVGYLEEMLAVRTPLTEEEFEASNKGQVARLLREGVFTDTHMLSLMYAGDMCQWHMQCSVQSTPSSASCGSSGGRDQDTTAPGVKPCKLKADTNSSQSDSTVVQCSKDATPASQGANPCNLQEASSSETPTHSLEPYALMDNAFGKEHTQQWTTDFDAPVLCDRYLSRYISVARGPLKSVGWSYERAVKLLVELRRGQQTQSVKSGSSAL